MFKWNYLDIITRKWFYQNKLYCHLWASYGYQKAYALNVDRNTISYSRTNVAYITLIPVKIAHVFVTAILPKMSLHHWRKDYLNAWLTYNMVCINNFLFSVWNLSVLSSCFFTRLPTESSFFHWSFFLKQNFSLDVKHDCYINMLIQDNGTVSCDMEVVYKVLFKLAYM